MPRSAFGGQTPEGISSFAVAGASSSLTSGEATTAPKGGVPALVVFGVLVAKQENAICHSRPRTGGAICHTWPGAG